MWKKIGLGNEGDVNRRPRHSRWEMPAPRRACARLAARVFAWLASFRSLRPLGSDLLPRVHPAALVPPLKFTPVSASTIRFRFSGRAVSKAWMA